MHNCLRIRSYISRIELYRGEKIMYSGERVDGDLATVSTTIITKNGTEVPADYGLFKRGDRWVIYDTSLEGIYREYASRAAHRAPPRI